MTAAEINPVLARLSAWAFAEVESGTRQSVLLSTILGYGLGCLSQSDEAAQVRLAHAAKAIAAGMEMSGLRSQNFDGETVQ